LSFKVNVVNISEEDERKGMKEAGLPDWIIDMSIEGNRLVREGRLSVVLPTVQEVTGKKARSFGQFTRDYKEAFE